MACLTISEVLRRILSYTDWEVVSVLIRKRQYFDVCCLCIALSQRVHLLVNRCQGLGFDETGGDTSEDLGLAAFPFAQCLSLSLSMSMLSLASDKDK